MHATTSFRILILALFLGIGGRAWAADFTPRDFAFREEEDAYQIRLARTMNEKGSRAMIAQLQHDLATNPRPYVQAWYANYLLYGGAFGLPDLVDPKRGFALAKEAMNGGSSYGLELVGRAYGDGVGPGYRDTPRAFRYVSEAAALGRATAMCQLATYYYFGVGVKRDRSKAVEWARRAGWLGATAGIMGVAEWLADPKYGPVDDVLSLELYYEAGEMGQRDARKHIEELAKKGDPAAAKYERLSFIVDGRQGAVARPAYVKQAARWLEQHTAPDDWEVQVVLAETMMEKLGPIYDAKAAREKLNRAAAAGNDDARALLGVMAWRGIGQKADPAAAITLWRQTADKGNALGLNWLGWVYWWGNAEKYGVPKDASKAFTLCRQAADLGYWRAQFNVADLYVHGIGTPKNYYLALKYYSILRRNGFIQARELEDRVLAMVKD
ncbi:MAG TPA: hypothetical protein VHE61_21665 [Opitutaceae bacterium]|nr:hypothetical protein [Opitutaceae bacterium]